MVAGLRLVRPEGGLASDETIGPGEYKVKLLIGMIETADLTLTPAAQASARLCVPRRNSAENGGFGLRTSRSGVRITPGALLFLTPWQSVERRKRFSRCRVRVVLLLRFLFAIAVVLPFAE